MVELKRRGFYMTPENGVVQPLEKTDTTLVVENPETGERWTVRRHAFEAAVDRNEVRRVEPNWEPAEAVSV